MGKSTQELRQDIEERRGELGETLDAIGDKVSPGRIVQRRKESLRNRFTSVKESVMGSAQSVEGSAQGVAGTVADQARQAPEQIVQQTQGNPLAAGAIAFGVGLLAASVIPPSKPEQQAAEALQDKVEPLKERAIEAGQQVKAEVQGAAREAAGQVKETATQAAQEVKDQAQSSAEHVKDEAASAASDVSERAKEGTRRTTD